MSNIFPAALLISYLFNINSSCYSQSIEETPRKVNEEYNTTIVINFKKNSDRHFMASLKQQNPLAIQPIMVPPLSNIIDSSNKLKTVIKVALSKPTYLAFRFKIFYIEPGDSLNISFETLVATKFIYKDTMTVNHGNVFFVWEPYSTPKFSNYLQIIEDSVKAITSVAQAATFLSQGHLVSIGERLSALVYKDFPNLKRTGSIPEKVNSSSIDRFRRLLFYHLQKKYNQTTDVLLKDAIQDRVTNMLRDAGTNEKDSIDHLTWAKYLFAYYFYKEINLDGNAILTKFDGCKDMVRQYAQLNLFKDGLLYDTATKSEIDNFINTLTYPPFKEIAFKIAQNTNRGVVKAGYINNVIRSTELFDGNDKKLFLGDLFKTSQQPFIVFDFCGSWCKPCIEEIGVYTKTKPLDNSNKVKPVWLFFENDKTKWLAVVEKYKLKKENCYVIAGRPSQDLMREFSMLFDWGGEFPHHFLFSKDGKIVDKKAPPLTNLDENRIQNKPSGNMPPPVSMPPK